MDRKSFWHVREHIRLNLDDKKNICLFKCCTETGYVFALSDGGVRLTSSLKCDPYVPLPCILVTKIMVHLSKNIYLDTDHVGPERDGKFCKIIFIKTYTVRYYW